MTVTELQIHRGYLSDLEKASDILYQLTYYGAQDEAMGAKLDLITENIETVTEMLTTKINKKEKELIKQLWT